MGSSIARWGNSLAVRLPKAVVEALGLTEGVPVTVTAEGDAVMVRRAPSLDLETLLGQITDENRHEPSDWVPMGRELL